MKLPAVEQRLSIGAGESRLTRASVQDSVADAVDARETWQAERAAAKEQGQAERAAAKEQRQAAANARHE